MKKFKITYLDLLLILVALIWGSNPMSMKIGISYVPPLAFNAIRLVVASIISFIVLKVSKSNKEFERKDLKNLAYICIFGFLIFQMYLVLGVSLTTAVNASIIMATLPINVILINKIFKVEDVTLCTIIGVVCSFVGVIVLILGNGETLSISETNIVGSILIIISQIAYAYYTVFSRELIKKYSSIQVTSYAIILSTLIFVLVSIKDIVFVSWRSIPMEGWIASIYSGAFVICFGNFIWLWAIGKIGSVRTSLYNNLVPIFGVILGCVFLHEYFGLIQFIGAVIVVLGLILAKVKGNGKSL